MLSKSLLTGPTKSYAVREIDENLWGIIITPNDCGDVQNIGPFNSRKKAYDWVFCQLLSETPKRRTNRKL